MGSVCCKCCVLSGRGLPSSSRSFVQEESDIMCMYVVCVWCMCMCVCGVCDVYVCVCVVWCV